MARLKYILILVIVVVVSSCKSSEKLLSEGRYQEAVEKSVKKLQKSPDSKDDIDVLTKAYPLANQQNVDRISFLQKDAQPDRWEKILDEYVALKNRQDYVNTVMPKVVNGKQIQFAYVNYDDKIVEAKRNAADYFYNHAKQLLNGNDVNNSRQAFYELQKVKQYSSQYSDVDKLMDEAKYKGTVKILINTIPNAQLNLPDEFYKVILQIPFDQLNREWTDYQTAHNAKDKRNFDVVANVRITVLGISPERVKESEFTETRQIQDGFEYVLDDRGNVRKDSLGNDMKRPRYKTISCKVIETRQSKTSHIEGVVEYTELSTNKVLLQRPIAADHIFDYASRFAQGDLDALSNETRKTLGGKPVPFPMDIDMIFATTEPLKRAIGDVLYSNANRFK